MCIVVIAYRASRRYPLIVAANRDERHRRPTAPADWWPERPDILGGRDLRAGGTWLGITAAGRLAAVTNVIEGTPADAPSSRGALVAGFLTSDASAGDYARSLDETRDRFGAYNLLLLDPGELHFASNRSKSAALAAGIHGCSNNRPGTDWPKIGLLGGALRNAIDDDAAAQTPEAERVSSAESAVHRQSAADRLAARLLDTLTGPAARGTLDTAPESLFIVGDQFGTRCSTVIVVDNTGRSLFIERSFGPGGTAGGTRQFAFAAPALATGAG